MNNKLNILKMKKNITLIILLMFLSWCSISLELNDDKEENITIKNNISEDLDIVNNINWNIKFNWNSTIIINWMNITNNEQILNINWFLINLKDKSIENTNQKELEKKWFEFSDDFKTIKFKWQKIIVSDSLLTVSFFWINKKNKN
jgi:hypothetical protein